MKERLKELYENSQLSMNGVLNAVGNGWISTAEAMEIVGAENAIDIVRAAKLMEISNACNAAIVAGIDLEFEDHDETDSRTDHFNLSLEDQSNIANLFRVVELGGTEFPYQADDGKCIVYTNTEIAQIYIAAQSHITYHTAYHNALKQYVQVMTDANDIAAVTYGMELPTRYATALSEKLTVAQTQMAAIMARLSG